MRPAFTLSLLLLFGASTGAAQVPGDRRGTQLPFLSTSARSAALGDASGAIPGRLDGMSTNPGTLSWVRELQAEYGFHRISPDASLQHLAAGFPAGNSTGLGLQMDILHHGGFGFFGRGELREMGFELRACAAVATLVAADLSAGVSLTTLHATTESDPVWAASVDAGLIYAPGRSHRFGIAVRGLGNDYDVGNPVLVPDIPDRRPARTLALSTAFEYPHGGHCIRFSLEGDKLLGRPGLLYRSGVEYQPPLFIGFRAGLQVRGKETAPRTGIGITAGPLTLDYAYLFNRRDRSSHLVTVRLSRD